MANLAIKIDNILQRFDPLRVIVAPEHQAGEYSGYGLLIVAAFGCRRPTFEQVLDAVCDQMRLDPRIGCAYDIAEEIHALTKPKKG